MDEVEKSTYEVLNNLSNVGELEHGAAMEEIIRTRSDVKNPFHVANHPQHAEAILRMNALYEHTQPKISEKKKEDEKRILGEIRENAEQKQIEAQVKKGEEELRREIAADPELRRKGITFDEAVKRAKEVLAQQGATNDDMQFLQETPWGSSAKLAKALLVIGEAMRAKQEWLEKEKNKK